MNTQRLLLDSYLKTLKLPTMRAEYKAIARKCSEAGVPYEDFLQQLAELEVQRRTAMAIERRLKQAQFPMVKEMASYRFADVPKLNKKYVLDLARCRFIETRTNQVLTGSPGVGKTHLAIAFVIGRLWIPSKKFSDHQPVGFHAMATGKAGLNV